MSFGGFKAFKVDVYGVNGGTMADVGAALADIANGILSTGQGWSVDTAKNPTTAYADQVSVGGYAQAVFLEHSSGARLMLTMNLDQGGFDASQLMNWEMNASSFDGSAYGGLSMCMLPNGQDFDVANITASSFLPSTALRIVGTGQSYSQSPAKSFLYDGVSSKFMRYMIIVRGNQIIVLARRSDWSDSCFMYSIGDIFQCSNNSDTYAWGVFRPFNNGSTIDENNDYGGSLRDQYSGYYGGSYANAEIYSSDGTLTAGRFIQGAGLANGDAICDADLSFVKYSYSNNQRRFIPFSAYITSQQGYGIVYDDGYKGILNPEIACAIGFTSGGYYNLSGDTVLDSGNLKYICNGICVGWDASNGALNFWS